MVLYLLLYHLLKSSLHSAIKLTLRIGKSNCVFQNSVGTFFLSVNQLQYAWYVPLYHLIISPAAYLNHCHTWPLIHYIKGLDVFRT